MKTQMRSMMRVISVIILLAVCGMSYAQKAKNPVTQPAKKHYDIAAFVWPSYHPDDRAKIFWPMGIGEWETVMKNKAKFEKHEQPRFPLWGYINEADPYVAEMEINAAADHGVNVFIFEWYWYDGMPFLEGHLNNGFLKARNNDLNAKPDWFNDSFILETLDAREMLQAGQHPLAEVLSKTSGMQTGQIFELITPFTPTPLIEKVTDKGCSAFV